MLKNMGKTDKFARMAIGVLIVLLWLFNVISGFFGGLVLVIGLVLIGTSYMNFCPAYLPLGINTCKNKEL